MSEFVIPVIDQPESFWIYLAGFIDSDGSIALCQNGPRLVASNADYAVLEEFKVRAGLGYLTAKKKYKPTHNPSWDWCVGSIGMRGILPHIIPHMRTKKERAQQMLEYLSLMKHEGGQSQSQELKDKKQHYYDLLKRNIRSNVHPSNKQKV